MIFSCCFFHQTHQFLCPCRCTKDTENFVTPLSIILLPSIPQSCLKHSRHLPSPCDWLRQKISNFPPLQPLPGVHDTQCRPKFFRACKAAFEIRSRSSLSKAARNARLVLRKTMTLCGKVAAEMNCTARRSKSMKTPRFFF